MSDREDLLAFFGLPSDAGLLEIERVYNERSALASDRLDAGDESARIELAALKEAYERLTGRGPVPHQERAPVTWSATATPGRVGQASPAESHLVSSSWWEAYLSLLFAIASLVALGALGMHLPHVYRHGGFLVPLGLLALSGALSVVATIAAEGELRRRRSGHLLARGSHGRAPFSLRAQVAWASSLLSRTVRWLIVPGLIAIIFLNFASLSGRWSLRH
jgi:hypothetical protein